jgi:hypothetical protein
VDVVVDRVAVLDKEAQDGQQVLGDVGHRDDQQRPGHIHAPGVVALQVGLGGRQVQPPLGQPAEPPPVALDHQLGRDLLDRRVDQGAGVAGGEEPDAGVVGEEQLGGVEPGRRGEGPPGRGGGVVGDLGGVAGVAGDRIMPAGGPAHRAQHQQPLQLIQGHRLVPGPVGQGAVGELIAQGEAARPAAEQRLHQREGSQLAQRLGAARGRAWRPDGHREVPSFRRGRHVGGAPTRGRRHIGEVRTAGAGRGPKAKRRRSGCREPTAHTGRVAPASAPAGVVCRGNRQRHSCSAGERQARAVSHSDHHYLRHGRGLAEPPDLVAEGALGAVGVALASLTRPART